MNIVVCVKQVPDPEGRIDVGVAGSSLRALGPNQLTSLLDLVAVEEALRLRERGVAGRITVIGLGRPSDTRALREGLALECDDALLLGDPAFDDGDSHATALALARAIGSVPPDLVLCGSRADDTREGQVGARVARMLGLPLVTRAVAIEVDTGSGRLRVTRKLARGDRELVDCPLPAVVTVESGLNRPRYPAARAVLQAKRHHLRSVDARGLGLAPEQVGLRGSRVRVIRLSRPRPRMRGLRIPDSRLSPAERLQWVSGSGLPRKQATVLEGDPAEVASRLVRFLEQERLLPPEEGSGE